MILPLESTQEVVPRKNNHKLFFSEEEERTMQAKTGRFGNPSNRHQIFCHAQQKEQNLGVQNSSDD